jgi:hypothetical protein
MAIIWALRILIGLDAYVHGLKTQAHDSSDATADWN